MKTITISTTNDEKLTQVLDAVQNGARSALFTVEDIHATVADAEARLKALGIPQRDWVDTKFKCESRIDMATGAPYPARYASTAVTILRRATIWVLVDVQRVTHFPRTHSGLRGAEPQDDTLTLGGLAAQLVLYKELAKAGDDIVRLRRELAEVEERALELDDDFNAATASLLSDAQKVYYGHLLENA